MKHLVLLLFIYLSALEAHAACRQQEQLYMSCKISGRDTQVSICFDKKQIYYRYGALNGKIELELEESLASIDYIPSTRVGQSVWDEINFRNGQYRYQIHGGFLTPRENLPEDEFSTVRFGDIRWGTIDVYRNNEILSELTCEFETINFNQVELVQALGISGVRVWSPLTLPE